MEELEDEVVEEEEEKVDQPIAIDYYARYIGGHPLYPKERDVFVVFWNHQLEVRHHFDKPAQIVIPYSDMTNVENMNEEQLKAARVIALGILGALWKKKYRYTVIQYKDELGSEQAIVMDFHGNIERTQQLIYQKMLESKKDKSYLSIETDAEKKHNETCSDLMQDRNRRLNQINENNFGRGDSYSEVNNRSRQKHKQNDDELKHTLKMRLVKGEISKEEYLEILKMIES